MFQCVKLSLAFYCRFVWTIFLSKIWSTSFQFKFHSKYQANRNLSYGSLIGIDKNSSQLRLEILDKNSKAMTGKETVP